MGGYIYSRLILALLSGTLTRSFLTILGVPFAVSLGIWVGVLSQFIPVVGTYLAAILPAVVALSSGGLGTMLWVILYFLAYQQIENYLIAPASPSGPWRSTQLSRSLPSSSARPCSGQSG